MNTSDMTVEQLDLLQQKIKFRKLIIQQMLDMYTKGGYTVKDIRAVANAINETANQLIPSDSNILH